MIGPRVRTLDDFWRMVWELDIPLIIMVTNLREAGTVRIFYKIMTLNAFLTSNIYK